jgi:hypothetical protein
MKKTFFVILSTMVLTLAMGSCRNASTVSVNDVDTTNVDTFAVDTIVTDTVSADSTMC